MYRCQGPRKKEERGKINVIKLIENSFGINSSASSEIVFWVAGACCPFFFLCIGVVLCIYQWNNRSSSRRSKSSVFMF